MTKDREQLKDILHSLDHQKWEAIGVEALAKDSATTMQLILLMTKLGNTSLSQDLATFWALKELMEPQLCDDCITLAKRIKNQILADYETWKLNQSDK